MWLNVVVWVFVFVVGYAAGYAAGVNEAYASLRADLKQLIDEVADMMMGKKKGDWREAQDMKEEIRKGRGDETDSE